MLPTQTAWVRICLLFGEEMNKKLAVAGLACPIKLYILSNKCFLNHHFDGLAYFSHYAPCKKATQLNRLMGTATGKLFVAN